VATPDQEDRFRRLYDDHEPAVRAFALRRVDVPADAADVVAETFVVAWRRLEEIPPRAERPWLLGVARRVLATLRRGHARRSRLAGRLRDDLERRVPSVGFPSDRHADVLEALAGLPSRDREILQLVAWDELTPAEAAVVLGVSDVTARTRLHRARARLRTALQRRTGSNEAPRGGHSQGDGHLFVAEVQEAR
jgi:RNA polymerase sigma-70 factor (ECF subfamily)